MVLSFPSKLYAFASLTIVVVRTASADGALAENALLTPPTREEDVRRAVLDSTGLNRLSTSATVDPIRRVNAQRKRGSTRATISDDVADLTEKEDVENGKSVGSNSADRRRQHRWRRHHSKANATLAHEDDKPPTQKPCIGSASCCLIPDAPYGTTCPDGKWINEMVAVDPRPGKVIMSIGCNKGNDAIGLMERWDISEDRFWSAHKLIDHYEEVLGSDAGYSCAPSVPSVTAYTHKKKLTPLEAAELPIGLCIEPMPANVELLRNASAQLGYNKAHAFGAFHIVQAAVTHSAAEGETADFADNPPGAETAKLWLTSMRGPKTTVPITTVDAIVAANKLSRVDILTIDAEGADADVLKGATSALASVRYLEFEVHRDLNGTSWDRTTLGSVVEDLSSKGFDCFWAGTNGKLMNMQKCWRDDFERGHWGNAACVKREDPWRAVLERFANA